MTSEEYFFLLEEFLFIEKLKQLDPFYEYSDSFSDGGRWKKQSQLHQELEKEASFCTEKQALLDKHMGKL